MYFSTRGFVFHVAERRVVYGMIMTQLIHGLGKGGMVKRTPTFTKNFRWQPENPGGPMPVRVELVGTFTEWKPVALKRDRVSGVWQLALHNIPGNRTHSYMLLVNRRPVADKYADGMAVPHTEEEKHYALETPRGPRMFMLYSQTK